MVPGLVVKMSDQGVFLGGKVVEEGAAGNAHLLAEFLDRVAMGAPAGRE